MKNIFDGNHISNKLSEDKINELKGYYKTYHRKCWAFKQAMKRFKTSKLFGNSLSAIFATGGIVSVVATSGVSLVAVSTVSVLIQGWMSRQNLDLKIQNCLHAYQSYAHVLVMLKDMIRSCNFEEDLLLKTVQNIDNYVIDTSRVVDKYLYQYDKIFTP